MKKEWHTLWINAQIITCENDNGLIPSGAIALKDGNIAWLGKMQDLPGFPQDLAEEVYDVAEACITPGFIDCHTHLVYAGNRANEFALRLQGVTYEEIAKAGGGIQSTVTATREASEEELFAQSLVRAKSLMESGVTILEIKSGYGLNLENELKMLRVAKKIEKTLGITVKTTFLGAHTFPNEYKNNQDEYVKLICEEMIPAISKEKLADSIDVFCEKIAFNLQQTENIFKAAQKHGLQIKCHAEQLSDSSSAELAANYNALSVDHLEHVSEPGIKAIGKSGTVAVLLPGAFYFLRETKLPPIDSLRKHHVPIAVASDCNPGTSPVLSLLFILNMACTLFRLTPQEALLGVTQHAARALGIEKTHGTLTVGKAGDLAIWNISHPDELAYYLGGNPLKVLIKSGKVLKS